VVGPLAVEVEGASPGIAQAGRRRVEAEPERRATHHSEDGPRVMPHARGIDAAYMPHRRARPVRPETARFPEGLPGVDTVAGPV